MERNTAITCHEFAVQNLDDFLADLTRLHASKAHAAALHAGITQHPSRHHTSVRLQHRVQVALRHERRQIGQVEVRRVRVLQVQ